MDAEPESTTNRVEPQSLAGLGGWLAFFVVLNIVTIGALCFDLFFILQALAAGASPGRSEDLVAALVIAAVWLTGALIGLFLVVTRHRWTPTYWILFLLMEFVLSLFLSVALEVPTNVSGESPTEATTASIGRTWIFATIWLFYWIRSKRVQQTFGTRGLLLLKRSTRRLVSSSDHKETVHLAGC